MYTKAEKQKIRKSEDPGAEQKKQLAGKAAVFPSGYVVVLLAVLEQLAESRRRSGKQKTQHGRKAGKAEYIPGMETQESGQPGRPQKSRKSRKAGSEKAEEKEKQKAEKQKPPTKGRICWKWAIRN